MYVDLGLAILRVVVGGVVMAHGLQKLGYLGGGGQPMTVGMMQKLSIRPEPFWAAVVAAAETGGGALMVLGFLGPFGPWVVIADMIVAAATVHWPNGFWNQKGGIEFPLLVATAALAVSLIGVGRWSVDALLGLSVPGLIVQGWIALMIVGAVLALTSRMIEEEHPGTTASS
jgi:putative oxidoreductase